MRRNKKLFILMFGLAVVLISGCRSEKKNIPDSMVTGNATIAADEALQPLIAAELDVFHSIYNFASIDCKYVSEYDAINLLLREKIRLAIVARPLNDREIDYLKSLKIIPESIPLAYDAVAVVVHPGNNTIALTTGQISQIIAGTITNWNQIADSKLTGNIRQVYDSESSGIIRSLNDSLHLNKKIAGEIVFAGSSAKLISQIASDPNAIGFVGFNLLSEDESLKVQESLKTVKMLAVSKAAAPDSTNSYKPSRANLYNGKYPISRRIYAIYTDPAASLARGFLAHLTSERGQKIIYRMGLKPEDDFQRLVNIKKDYK